MLTYEYCCKKCGLILDESRAMADRGRPAVCKCGGNAPRVYATAPRVNWFPGSQTFDSRAENLDRMAKEAQAEGFRSKGEIEEAEGQAHERAKQLGIPVTRILGGTPAQFEGKHEINPQDAARHRKLYQRALEAQLSKDKKQIRDSARALREFETRQRKKQARARRIKLDRDAARKAARAQARQFSRQV